MTTAWDVYDKLFRPRGYGHAMWSPAPHARGTADIADVGWIWKGRFYRFINAAQPAQNPINQCWHEFSQSDYEPIEIDSKQLIEEPDLIMTKALGSRSVSARAVSTGANGHGAGFDVKVKCSQQQAALLLLPDGRAQQRQYVGTQIKNYVRQNEPKWWAMAQLSNISVRREELLFVTGWVKTSDWELAVCTYDAWSGEVSLKAGVGHLAAISFSGSSLQEIISGWECKSLSHELKAKTHGNAHCIFLQYCKIKHRLGLWPRMKAAAEPQDPSGANDDANEEAVYIIKDELSDSRQGSPLEYVPQIKRDDPVDDILDYILENAAAAEIAFATTQDVACLLRMNTNTNEGINFRDIIGSAGPVIEVDETGMGFLCLDEHQGANMWTDSESSSIYIGTSDGRSSGYSIEPAALIHNYTEVHDLPYYDVAAVNNTSSPDPAFMADTNPMAENLRSDGSAIVADFTEGECAFVTSSQPMPLSAHLPCGFFSHDEARGVCYGNELTCSQYASRDSECALSRVENRAASSSHDAGPRLHRTSMGTHVQVGPNYSQLPGVLSSHASLPITDVMPYTLQQTPEIPPWFSASSTSDSSYSIPVKVENYETETSGRRKLDEKHADDHDQQVPAKGASKRRRVQPTCVFCRGRKIVCDGNEPTCSQCARRDLTCEYRQQKELNSDIQELHSRIDNVQARLAHMKALSEQDTPILEQIRAANPELPGISPLNPGDLNANFLHSTLHEIKEILPSGSAPGTSSSAPC
ncbi:hypothetical protein WOLCODRAFT_137007 [Wolfiporia cocos MD-104 SS10]|uniref:Zn(2)-C6 fungal-type domain-containing protein n=1 Tax=Wolfiporia cocos (strain MD-104) TaxID=742152 RepID=A0A2H3JEZ2_WOLCO|nr:hypothetical protein WOLCODRAFT_137007 [Wolfiporia cocos MD-104 SS10]